MNILSKILFVFAASTMIAVADNGGSSYSRFGFGDLQYATTSSSVGMGGSRIAVLSPQIFESLNPATWTQINLTRFTVSALFEGYNIEDNNGSSKRSVTFFNGFSLAIPIAPSSGIAFSGGLVPYSKLNSSIVVPGSFNGVNFTSSYLDEGGLSQVYIGLSGKIGDDVHVGGKFNYYVGTLRRTFKQTFVNTSQYSNAEVEKSTTARGISGSIGIVYSGLSKFMSFDEKTSLTIGAVMTTSADIHLTAEELYKYTADRVTRDTTTSAEIMQTIPYSLGLGMSFNTDRYLIAGDFYAQPWNRANNQLAIPPSITFQDYYRYSIGGELQPRKELSAPYLQRLAYRLGFFYNQTYYKINGRSINEIGVTGGIGIPIFLDTRLNIGLEYSRRGTTELGLQQDNIFRLSLTLNGAELWFVRPEQE